MRPKQSVVVGPWSGGFNTKDDPRLISDAQLTDVINMGLSDRGCLGPRPALRYLDSAVTPIGSLSVYGTNSKQGVFRHNNGSQFLVGDDLTALTTTAFTGISGSDVTGFYQVLNYNYFTYYLNRTGNKSFRVAIGATSGAVTTLANVPNSSSGVSTDGLAFIFKDRMWVVYDNRVNYSKATDPTIWAAPDGGFFDVGPGDGNNINSIVVSNDVMYIFKSDSVWAFQFTSDPSTDGVLRVIVTDKGANNAIVNKNVIYTVDDTSIYMFQSGQFQDIGRQLGTRETTGNAMQYGMFVWDNKLHVQVGSSVCYVLNLNTGSWTKYDITDAYDSDWTKTAEVFNGLTNVMAVGGGIFGTYTYYLTKDYELDKIYDTTNKVSIYRRPRRYFTTKMFTFNDTFEWKRFYALRVQGEEDWVLESGDAFISWLAQGIWYAYDGNAKHSADGFAGFYKATRQDFDRIAFKNFRFRELQFTWIADEVRYTPDEASIIEANQPPVVDLHKLQLVVAQKAAV